MTTNPFADGPDKGNLTVQGILINRDRTKAESLMREAGHKPEDWGLKPVTGRSASNPFAEGPGKGNLTAQGVEINRDPIRAMELIQEAGHAPADFGMTTDGVVSILRRQGRWSDDDEEQAA